MSCQECVCHSATRLAAIAEELSPQMARQLFTAMYPEPACLPMGHVFLQILRTSAGTCRRPPASTPYFSAPVYAEPVYQAAVA